MNQLNILITGSEGFIGKHLCKTINNTYPQHNVFGAGRKPIVSNSNYQYIPCDFLDKNNINNLPDKMDVIIHLAGDGRTFINPIDFTSQLSSNVIMTANIADYAQRSGVKLIIYASSVYIYSGNKAPFKEKHIPDPIDNLGVSKLCSENILRSRSMLGHYKSISLRLFTVYGLGAKKNQFIPEVIKKIKSNNKLEFHSSEILRDFIYIDDVIKAFILSINLFNSKFIHEVINIGTGYGTTIKEVVLMLADKLDSKKKIHFINDNKNILDTSHIANIDYANKRLNWKPIIQLSDGLDRVLDYL